MSNLYKDAPLVKVVMLKGKDGAKSALSELTNDMTYLTREEIITLVNNIIDTGSVGDIDTGFVTRLVEQNKGRPLQFWIGTQAEYDAISTKIANMFYIITDDSFKSDIENDIANLQDQINNIEQKDYEVEISALQTTTQELSADVAELQSITYPVYKAGDIDVTMIRTAGYVTGSGQRVTFNIPIGKWLDAEHLELECRENVVIGDIPEQATLTIRQKGRYFWGSADEAQDCIGYITLERAGGAGATSVNVSFSIGQPLFAREDGHVTDIPIDNNAPVGISFRMVFRVVEVE